MMIDQGVVYLLFLFDSHLLFQLIFGIEIVPNFVIKGELISTKFFYDDFL